MIEKLQVRLDDSRSTFATSIYIELDLNGLEAELGRNMKILEN